MTVKKVTVHEAMVLAKDAYRSGRYEEADQICKDILRKRPHHSGAKHLSLSVEHKIKATVFTAITLHDPSLFDIGDFSYGEPKVMLHNQID